MAYENSENQFPTWDDEHQQSKKMNTSVNSRTANYGSILNPAGEIKIKPNQFI